MNNEDNKKVSYAQLVKNMRENIPGVFEYEELRARIASKRLMELEQNGFTREEALEIIKTTY